MLNIKASKAFDKPKEKTRQLSKWGNKILRVNEVYDTDDIPIKSRRK